MDFFNEIWYFITIFFSNVIIFMKFYILQKKFIHFFQLFFFINSKLAVVKIYRKNTDCT